VFSTVTALVLTVVFLMPGFVLVQTLRRVREYPESGSDLALTLRALGWSLVIHLAFIWWSSDLFLSIEELDDWPDHRDAIVAYAGVVVIVVPITIGVALGYLVTWLERHDESLRHARDRARTRLAALPLVPVVAARVITWPLRALPALARLIGANPLPPTPWERLQPFLAFGALVVVRTKDGKTVAGKFGSSSFMSISDKPELLLEEVWSVDAAGVPGQPLDPARSLWLAQSQIDFVEVIPIPQNPT
jgi:hypothetical protein